MNNLQYCNPDTRKDIADILASPSIHFTVQEGIRKGLEHDCLDAWRDAQLVADMLKRVCDDCMGK